MATVILVRHGRTAANVAGVLAGRTPGVDLDDVGRTQAERTADRLAVVPLVGLVSSPLERCRQTSGFILNRQRHENAPPLLIDDDLTEADYGDWQGRTLAELAKETLWSAVQQTPSSVTFPGGESMAGMQARAVAAIARHDAAFEAEHGKGAVWVAVSHGDVIKSILADALGTPLDRFQRISIGPASVSIVHFGASGPVVHATNTDSGDLSWLRAAAPDAGPQLGGGAGNPASGHPDAQPAPVERS